eukprot:jgi/Chlat1/2967/Chrsp2S04695
MAGLAWESRSLVTLALVLSLLVTWVAPGHCVQYQLLASLKSVRYPAFQLSNAQLSGNAYVFVSPDDFIAEVKFYMDDAARVRAPMHVETRGPFDLVGSTPDNQYATGYNFNRLRLARHTLTAAITDNKGKVVIVTAEFSVVARAPPPTIAVAVPPYRFLVSYRSTRTPAFPLASARTHSNIFVFVSPSAYIETVAFYWDNLQNTGKPWSFEDRGPFDLAGSMADNTLALPLDTTKFRTGSHTLGAIVTLSTKKQVKLSCMFSIARDSAGGSIPFALRVSSSNRRSPSSLLQGSSVQGQIYVFLDPYDASSPVSFYLDDPGRTRAPWSLEKRAPFDFAGTDKLTEWALPFDTSKIRSGQHTITAAIAQASGLVVVSATFTVDPPLNCPPELAPDPRCKPVIAPLPFTFTWGGDRGGKVFDRNGLGTGFTYVERETNNNGGYLPRNLLIDTAARTLTITATPGESFENKNNQDNKLGIGIAPPSDIILVSTTVVNPPIGYKQFEQAGVWFGSDQDNYAKLTVQSTGPWGMLVELFMEEQGIRTNFITLPTGDLTGKSITLELQANPASKQVQGSFWVTGKPVQFVGSLDAPPIIFSFDAATIDPLARTRTFAGIFASTAYGQPNLQFTFANINMRRVPIPNRPPVTLPPGVKFNRVNNSLSWSPTGLAWAPDNKLYATDYTGSVHRLTLNAQSQIVRDERFDILRGRLATGIAVEPSSTPTNVKLWVMSSLGTGGPRNPGISSSGKVTRLTGPNFNEVVDYITGLPRSVADHGPNSMHFARGKLYFSIGSNTGSGGCNDFDGDFGQRPEQLLSAGLFEADVLNPSWRRYSHGNCESWVSDKDCTAATTFPATCKVQPYVTGMRNVYDFLFHSNGHVYAGDNGVGLPSTVPARATPGCQGLRDYQLPTDPLDPGEQPDLFYDLKPGYYYGHANPARGQCVWHDGSFQGVKPLSNYRAPMLVLGDHISPDGITEYTYDGFCGRLKGHVLITGFSIGDNILRLQIDSTGTKVLSVTVLAEDFLDPLPIIEKNGKIYVGAFNQGKANAGQINVLIPDERGLRC